MSVAIQKTELRLRCGLIGGIFCLGLTACATINVPSSPALPQTAVTLKNSETPFANASSVAFSTDREVLPDWWTRFDDPMLGRLVKLALVENRNLDVARANIAAADAALRRAQLDRSFGSSSTATLALNNPVRSSDVDLNLNAGLSASWELDAFGRIESQIRAAEFNRNALIEARRDTAVIIASQTAQAYVDLRSAQQRLAVATENAALQAEGLDLLMQLVEAGRSNDLDLNRSRTLYLTTRASLPVFQADVRTAVARLSALTGRATMSNDIDLSSDAEIPQHRGALDTGSPAALIRRRPDIRQAEARMAERLALGTIERTRLFPTLTFNANLNAFFGSFGDLTRGDSLGFGLGPALQWDGPDLRRVRADIDAVDAQSMAAFAAYEQTVFEALSDVEAALALYDSEVQRHENLRAATESARNALDLARLRFEEGLDDFLDVLDAQRTLLDAQDRLVQNDALTTTYAISAYRALGGMWTATELNATALTDESPTP